MISFQRSTFLNFSPCCRASRTSQRPRSRHASRGGAFPLSLSRERLLIYLLRNETVSVSATDAVSMKLAGEVLFLFDSLRRGF